MQKKKILKIAPVQTTKTGIIAQNAEIRGEKHLLLDFYEAGQWWLRAAYTQNQYSYYIVSIETWSCAGRWNLYVDGIHTLGNMVNDQKLLGKASEEAVRQWTKETKAYEIIRHMEDSIDARALKMANERQKEEMEKLFDTVPELPEHFWIRIKLYDSCSNLIYYKRHGKYSDYKCAQCGLEWTDKNIVPRKGDMYKCPHCKESGKLEWANRSTRSYISSNYTVFQQTTDGKLMSRTYWSRQERAPYMSMDREVVEVSRIFFVNKQRKEYANAISYGSREREWRKGWGCWKSEIFSSRALNDAVIVLQNTELKYMPVGLLDLTASGRERTVGGILDTAKTYVKCPQVEILFKMGLSEICRELIINEGSSSLINRKKTRPEEVLKIDKLHLKYIQKDEKGTKHRLRICQWMKKYGIKFTEENVQAVEKLMERYSYQYANSEENIKTIIQYTTVVKAVNYIEKQCGEHNFDQVRTEYIDYLKERAGQGYDMTNTVYLFPKDLHATYARIRMEAEASKNKEHDEKLMQQFQRVAKRFKELSKKYTYEDAQFIVRPAKDVMEIIQEGRFLHHCVGSENQRYMRNHDEGKSFILMLRKVSEPDIPYATIEIDGTQIRQWYQANDRQPDKEMIQPWLDEYVNKLKNKQLKAAV